MNNRIKNFDEFQERLKSQKLSNTLYNKSLQRITMKQNRLVKPFYFRASFIAIFLSVFFTVSVAAMKFTGFELFNSNGEKIYEVLPLGTDEENKKFTEAMFKYNDIIEKIKNEIPAGEFVYFLPVDAYRELGFSTLLTLDNGTTIKSLSEVPIELNSVNLKSSLINKYHYSKGTIYYESPEAEESTAEEMYKEAIKNNLEYIVQKGTLPSNISFVELNYKINESDYSGVTIRLNPTSGTRYTSEDLAEYIKINEHGTDFLYSREQQRILFVVKENGQKTFVDVSIDLVDERFNVENELLPIALSLLK